MTGTSKGWTGSSRAVSGKPGCATRAGQGRVAELNHTRESFQQLLGISASNGSSSSSIPILTTSRGTSTGSMSLPIGANIVIQNFLLDFGAHCSATLLRVLRKIVGFCGLHFSAQVEIENVVSEIHDNELASSIPVHQLLKMSSHSPTNFAVNRNHVATVMFQIEILSSFARDLCSTAQHCVHHNKSSVQRSEHTVFIITKKLPRSTIKNALATGCSMVPSISCSFWTEAQWTCVYCSSCVKIHSHPFKPFRTTHGDKIKTSKRK